MKNLISALAVVALFFECAGAQTSSRPLNGSMNPCSGGVASANVDVEPVTDLQSLVAISDLIIIGRVVNVPPAVAATPERPLLIRTDSLIAVTEVLRGSLPSTTATIALSQLGGRAGNCEVVVPDD